MSRPLATTITFLISALAHELVMGCITRKFRGYGFFAMMLQMPIVMLQRSKWVRGRTLLNNVLFWCSMILGLSMVSLLTPSERLQSLTSSYRCAHCMYLYSSRWRKCRYPASVQHGVFWLLHQRAKDRLAKYPSHHPVALQALDSMLILL